jgi:hypothetical protein
LLKYRSGILMGASLPPSLVTIRSTGDLRRRRPGSRRSRHPAPGLLELERGVSEELVDGEDLGSGSELGVGNLCGEDRVADALVPCCVSDFPPAG